MRSVAVLKFMIVHLKSRCSGQGRRWKWRAVEGENSDRANFLFEFPSFSMLNA